MLDRLLLSLDTGSSTSQSKTATMSLQMMGLFPHNDQNSLRFAVASIAMGDVDAAVCPAGPKPVGSPIHFVPPEWLLP